MTQNTTPRKIYLTVDTECHHIEDLNQSIYGKTDKGEIFGIEKLFQLGNELKIPVNVFLDIPECHRYGDDHIRRIVDLADRYGHPVFLHVHPDYIGDPERKHLWEYTEEEQRQILKTALEDYERFCGPHSRIVFKAGAWGVNDTTYKVLRELLPEQEFEVVDVSYVYKSRRRCHLSAEEYGAANAARVYRGIQCLPNTTYIGYDYLGKQRATTLNVPNPNFGVFRDIIDKNTLHDITYAMHSWDFTKRWFFRPGRLAGDKAVVRNFIRCVKYAQSRGYVFENLNNFTVTEDQDQCINLCSGIVGKLKSMWYNYRSFAAIGRSYKKYAPLYFLPAALLILILIIAAVCLF